MDETTLKIAIAAFIHDIGNFVDSETPGDDGHKPGDATENVASFITGMKEHLPPPLNSSQWGEGDPFVDLVLKSSNPGAPMQWIVAMASRISKGMGRDASEPGPGAVNGGAGRGGRLLLPLFEQLMARSDDQFANAERFSYCYPPEPISSDAIFPIRREPNSGGASKNASEAYGDLFKKFSNGVKGLDHKSIGLEMWFEHFESLMMICTSLIPARGMKDGIPDVALYDHCKASAALATALHQYHARGGSYEPESIRKMDEPKFLVISGAFQGIQNFIFDMHGDTRRYRTKLLRGRSFAVSLLSELAGDMICNKIGLPTTSIIVNAAGKFAILAPNTPEVVKSVETVERGINDWLVKISNGEIVVGLSYQVAAPEDFTSGNFTKLWKRINLTMEKKKYSSIDLSRHGGAVNDFLDRFNNKLEHPICPICRKRPSEKEVEGTGYIREAKSACALCRDHIFLGANLVKNNRLAIIKPDARIGEKKDRLLEPIFDEYQLVFPDKFPRYLVEKGDLLKYWNLTYYAEDAVSPDMTVKFINGYVPVYGKEDVNEEWFMSDKKEDEEEQRKFCERIEKGDAIPKTLNHIAQKALIPGEDGKGFQGVDALGVLKADVDNLGLMMAGGLNPESFTLSRLTTLSRQLHYFFTLYLPHYLSINKQYQDIYTVFAGGDDLFLIGPWNRVIDLVISLRESFEEYVCGNKEVHFSAGISFHKPHTPVDVMAKAAEEELDKSKTESDEKNRLTLFSETAAWNKVEEFSKIQRELGAWMDKGTINKAMLYRLNELMDMAALEKRIIGGEKKDVYVDHLACTKWHSKLAYTCERNVAGSLKGESRKKERKRIINEVNEKLADWLKSHGARLKIPVWRILYNMR